MQQHNDVELSALGMGNFWFLLVHFFILLIFWVSAVPQSPFRCNMFDYGWLEWRGFRFFWLCLLFFCCCQICFQLYCFGKVSSVLRRAASGCDNLDVVWAYPSHVSPFSVFILVFIRKELMLNRYMRFFYFDMLLCTWCTAKVVLAVWEREVQCRTSKFVQ